MCSASEKKGSCTLKFLLMFDAIMRHPATGSALAFKRLLRYGVGTDVLADRQGAGPGKDPN